MAEKGRRDSNDMELGDLNGKKFEGVPKEPIRYTPAPSAPLASHPVVPIIAYCLSSILMTVMNKYVVSGTNWNMNFLLLAVQVGSALIQLLMEHADLFSQPFVH